MEGPDTETYGFLWGIAADAVLGVSLAALVLWVDRRRRNRVEEVHRKIIKDNADRLIRIYALAASDVDKIETDEEAISERLSKYMERNYSLIEHAMNNMEIYRAHRTGMTDAEKSNIDQVIGASRSILDEYCRRDISASSRVSLWNKQENFLVHYKKMVEAGRGLGVK